MTPVFFADAFGDGFGSGNPAAVVLLAGNVIDAAALQALASYLNQPATAFVSPADGDRFGLRWFSPRTELELCGHGTAAATHVLARTGAVDTDSPATFMVGRQTLRARAGLTNVTLNFPASPPVATDLPADIRAAAGINPITTLRSSETYVCELDSAASVEQARPDLQAAALQRIHSLVVTAAGGDGADVTSRVFAPGIGIPEDQATGSAHCVLAPYWAAKLGSNILVARQASPRGGRFVVELRDDRVELQGTVTTVLDGHVAWPW